MSDSESNPAPAYREARWLMAGIAALLALFAALGAWRAPNARPTQRNGDVPARAGSAFMNRAGPAEDLADADERTADGLRGLGELRAKKPGARDELAGAVRLVNHALRVRIAGIMAHTEIEETFENTSNEALEGIYRFAIPSDASLERLALDVDGRLVDGAFVDRERAAAIWRGAIVNAAPTARRPDEDIVWVPGPWRDPALLEWQRGGRFELRVFPIPKRGTRRVLLSYTQVVPALGERRHYTYPLSATGGRIDALSIDVSVRGHDARARVVSSGYPLRDDDDDDDDDDDVRRLTYAARDVTASGDLEIEYALPNAGAELRAYAYRPSSGSAQGRGGALDTAPYVAFALRPELPAIRDDARPALAIVVDSSRSMIGESYARATRLAARVAADSEAERVVLLACDTDCRIHHESLGSGARAERETRRFFAGIEPDGASDPARAVRAAQRALNELGASVTRIVYIGDGTPTMGPIRPSHIERELQNALPAERARVTAVAVGPAADTETLAALARGGGGVLVRYAPGEPLERTAFAVVASTAGCTLRDVSITLPDGLYALVPQRMDPMVTGGEQIIAARMAGSEVHGDVVLRGRFGSQSFERRYPIAISASADEGSAFVPRLYAGLRIGDLERDGSADAKGEALALSTRFNVASRYTSLLVLESEAMFKAFGLERTRETERWSGDDTAAESVSPKEELSEASADPDLLQPSSSGGADAQSALEPEKKRALAPAPAPRSAAKAQALGRASDPWDFELEPRPRRRMIPMRRIWERKGEMSTTRLVPKSASFDAIARAERASFDNPDHREPLRKLYALLALAGDVNRSAQVVERWIARNPLDVDALTARADLAARAGDRDRAIRLLGSVLDAQPGNVLAARRLERLERWSDHAELGCRYLIAAAEQRTNDTKLLADAVRCSRRAADELAASELLAPLRESAQRQVEALLRVPAADDGALLGDLSVRASWTPGEDLDLAILDGDGRRASFLGAPTRAIISARDATSDSHEALALRGASAGEYVIEIVRSRESSAPVRGELVLSVAGVSQRIPFTLMGTRATVALATIRSVSRLVPVESWSDRAFAAEPRR